MAYDALRFSARGQQIDKDGAFFQFDERCHLELIGELESSPARFPLLSRMRDPYGDSDFHASEISKLSAEASRLAAETTSESLRRELMRFAAVLATMDGSSDNLCFFGD
jgi:hypothetical protein